MIPKKSEQARRRNQSSNSGKERKISSVGLQTDAASAAIRPANNCPSGFRRDDIHRPMQQTWNEDIENPV